MKPIKHELAEWMRESFRAAFPDEDVSSVSMMPATNPRFGDYQCNDALPLAKRLGRPPREIAQEALDRSRRHKSVASCNVAGPGFINVILKAEWLIARLEALAAEETLGMPDLGGGRTVVMDYSSPNVAKPMHIGHIRSTIIGHALNRIYRSLGYAVVADNHVGDWGTQFGILIMGYRHFLDKEALAERPVEELERIYVQSCNRSREDEDWLRQCRAELVKLQAGEEENRALWERFVRLSLSEFDRLYERLGVTFDLVRGESHYQDQLAEVVQRLEQSGLARESEGARVVFLEDRGLPPCIVRKSDGGYNYATTDVAAALSRLQEFHPEKIVYVTDERQQLHFRQLFAIVDKLTDGAAVMEHVWFGLMRLPEGTFSSREGNVIKLEALLDEAERRALEVVRKSSSAMAEADRREVARAVGIGAVKYADLSQNPQTTITFSWEKAMALDGNSAPYLQYACARIGSVLDKYRKQFPGKDWQAYPIVFSEPIERTIGLQIVRFPEAVMRAADIHRPSVVADALYDLAQAYSSFYQNVPFLKAEEGRRESRLRLSELVARTLRMGLEILGIDTPSRI